jgi:deoxyribodipyrimidine photolyase-related protein
LERIGAADHSWCATWDALYWRFIDNHSAFFAKNPRMSVMVAMKTKLGDKLTEHKKTAEAFLKKLHA